MTTPQEPEQGDQVRSLQYYTEEESPFPRRTFSIQKRHGVDGFFLQWHRDDVNEVPMTAEHLVDFSRRLAEIVATEIGADNELLLDGTVNIRSSGTDEVGA